MSANLGLISKQSLLGRVAVLAHVLEKHLYFREASYSTENNVYVNVLTDVGLSCESLACERALASKRRCAPIIHMLTAVLQIWSDVDFV